MAQIKNWIIVSACKNCQKKRPLKQLCICIFIPPTFLQFNDSIFACQDCSVCYLYAMKYKSDFVGDKIGET